MDPRTQIDLLDDEIAKLYVQRMGLEKDALAADGGLIDPADEGATLSRVTADVPDDMVLYVKQVFDSILQTSRAYQRRLSAPSSPLSAKVSEALARPDRTFPSRAVVACQGVAGAYSGVAAGKVFAIPDTVFFKEFDGVFTAVEKGFCRFGVLPIENSAVGSVNAVYDLMKKHRFYIVRSVKLQVSHHLLAKPGTRLEDITEILSHEQALNQCSQLLASLPKSVKITVATNTAVAAKTVAEREGNIACISSRDCAGLYGLSILKSNVQDRDNNFTRFIVISKDLEIYRGANRISIMMTLPHEAGSLNKTLNKFSTLGLNLTKLESRPLPNTNFEFMFYFDFEGQPEDKDVLSLLGDLDLGSDEFAFLGAYSEI